MVTQIKLLNKIPRRSPPREIVMEDRNDKKSNNIVNYDANNTIQIKDSIAHYFQKKKYVKLKKK